MPAMLMMHDDDPKDVLLKKLGDVSDVEVSGNEIVCAVYERPEKTASGLWTAPVTREEDKTQGKVGLIVRMGPLAFDDPEGKWGWPPDMAVGDWIYYRASDGWAMTVNGVLCRAVRDTSMRGRIQHPDQVW